MTLGDGGLLLLRIAGDLDDLHAIAQRRHDRIQYVGRRDEQHPRQVERHIQIVIAEVVFCSGSSTSSSALDGSPRKSAVTLSTSSIIKTGLLVSARLMP